MDGAEPIPHDRQALPAGQVATLTPLVRRLIAPNAGPFTFTGTIHKVTVDLAPELILDDDHRNAHFEAQAAALLARV